MNIRLLLGLLGLAFAAHAQSSALPPPLPGLPFDSLTHAPNYHGVVAVPGLSAAELQGRAREWVALTFQNAHQVTQLDDPARGVLIGRGYQQVIVNLNKNNRGTIRLICFTFRLDFREGRYRYELRDLGAQLGVGILDGLSTDSHIRDTYKLALGHYQWLIAGAATLTSSQRQLLMSAGATNNADDYRADGALSKTWLPNSALINTALLELLQSLARHEQAPAAKW